MARPAKRSKEPKTPPRVPLWPKEGARLSKALTERKIGQTAFASRVGVKFHNVHRWTKGHEFTPANQARAARELGLPDDAFTDDATAAWLEAVAEADRLARQAEAQTVLAQFQRDKPVAAALSPSDWRVLRSIQFADADIRPSVAFYEAVAFALKGAIRIDEIASVARENAELDRTLSYKPPLKKR